MKTWAATSAEVEKRNTRMSNQNELAWQVPLLDAQEMFSQLLENALVSLKHDDLLMPESADYRVCKMNEGELGFEVDLHLAVGAIQRIIVPIAENRAKLSSSVSEVRERLADILYDLDGAVQLRAEVENKVRASMSRLEKAGVCGRVIDVRLSPIDLINPKSTRRIMIEIEGAACQMLRPFRDLWFVDTTEDVTEEIAQFRERQRELFELREQARATGAVGFVDPLALIAFDRLPGGRREALRSVVSTKQQQWFLDESGRSRESVGLTWHDGIVRGVADLGDGVELSGSEIIVRGDMFDETCVGRGIREFSSHPALLGLRDGLISEWFNGMACVKIDSIPVPFASDGSVLETA
ncbi:MAG: hypothetical protein ABJO64_11245 [Nitratireductor sp.]